METINIKIMITKNYNYKKYITDPWAPRSSWVVGCSCRSGGASWSIWCGWWRCWWWWWCCRSCRCSVLLRRRSDRTKPTWEQGRRRQKWHWWKWSWLTAPLMSMMLLQIYSKSIKQVEWHMHSVIILICCYGHICITEKIMDLQDQFEVHFGQKNG